MRIDEKIVGRQRDYGAANSVYTFLQEQLCQANPFAINWEPVRPIMPRMQSLHPDFPNPKWKPNKANDLEQN